MTPETPLPTRLEDYQPTPYLIDTVDLDFRLEPSATQVRSRLAIRSNPASSETGAALVLDGELIALQSVAIDGRMLAPDHYAVSESALTIPDVPGTPFSLEIVTVCNPKANTQLSGLYVSNG